MAKKRRFQRPLSLIITVVLLSFSGIARADTPRIAIIIDDIGYSLTQGTVAARFPAPLTLAVLPYAPNSHALARLGHLHGKEIMLHAPMSTLNPHPLDRGALKESMDYGSFIRTLRENIAVIPYITGVNNHMGSALTQHQQSMNWLMQELQHHGLFFVDSRTTAASVAHNTAREYAIPSRSRDIFLDHERTPEAVDSQFQKLVQLARREGSAIAIGHPVAVTMNYLASRLPRMEEEGLQLVSVSELIPQDVSPITEIKPTPTQKPAPLPDAAPASISKRAEPEQGNDLPRGHFPEDRVTIY